MGGILNILVVDTDRDMVEMLTGWLRTRGYTVHYSLSADKIRPVWLERKPDLVILEVGLPGGDPLAICRELRTHHDALILAVSIRNDAQIETHCLESGADAYLPKPFLPKQLLAHIHALSRRVRSTLQRQPSSLISVGPIRFDVSRNEVSVNGKMTRLTPTESRILQVLAVNTGDVCTLNQIVSHAWGYSDDGDTYLIKAHIRHLREKIEPVPSKPRFIRTIAGVGYTFTVGGEPVAKESSDEEGSDTSEEDDQQRSSLGNTHSMIEEMGRKIDEQLSQLLESEGPENEGKPGWE
jgi:DNA-binding response OmpR family regulator